MRKLRASMIAATTAVASLAMYAPPAVGAAGTPVCADPIPRELCGGRVFAEPLQSATGLTYRSTVQGLTQLAEDHPDWVTFETFGDGSADGLDLLVVEVTAPADEPGALPIADRKVVLVNQSIHGNEPGGREGAPRYVEDLVSGRDAERTALLGRVRLVQTFINPDGWTAGDHDHAQTGGGLGLWARQNGDGAVTGAADFGLGIDLNRQAPWPGQSRRNPAPVEAPEMAAYVEFVRALAAESDIVGSVDIHGEVTDAAALIMLSAGEYDLDEAMGARAEGDAMVDTLFEELDESQASMLTQVLGEYPAGKLIASSEFAGGGTDTGYVGDWVSMASGGDSASLSTIELYNFAGSPGVNSLTARPEVMQLYRDTVAGILGSMVEQAAVAVDTTLTGTGAIGWVDAHEVVTDPVNDVPVSSARFYDELSRQAADGMTRLTPDEVTAESIADLDAVIVSRDGLAADSIEALRTFAAGGGNVVLTDSGVALADALFDGAGLAPAVRIDGDARVGFAASGALVEGVREDAFMIIEPVPVGYNRSLAGAPDNVPTWVVDEAAWTRLGGTVQMTAGSGVAGGTATLGDGSVSLIGLLTPPVLVDGAGPIDHGIEAHGVLDTGYIMLANALGGELVAERGPSVEGGELLGTMTTATAASAPAPARDGRAVPAALVLLVGAALSVRTARRVEA